MLEYEAPKAFFIGASAKEFLQFDERTRQHLLAPLPKRAALHALSAAQLAPVFPQFGSVNPEAALAANARAHSLTNPAALPPPRSIFTPPRSDADFNILPLSVEQWLRTGGTNQTAPTRDDMADALRECLARGDRDRAKAILSTAGRTLKSGPELRFLGRIWEQTGGKL